MPSDQQEVGIEASELLLDERATDGSELSVALQDVEDLGGEPEPTAGSRDRVLGAMGSPCTENGETSNGQNEMPARKNSARFLLVIESFLSSTASVRPSV